MSSHGCSVAGQGQEVGGDDVVEDLGEPGPRQVEQETSAQDLIYELHLQHSKFLSWSQIVCLCVCVRVCVRACVCVCVHACTFR